MDQVRDDDPKKELLVGEPPLPWWQDDGERRRVLTLDEGFESWIASRLRETRE